jgi:hypothetical protein
VPTGDDIVLPEAVLGGPAARKRIGGPDNPQQPTLESFHAFAFRSI